VLVITSILALRWLFRGAIYFRFSGRSGSGTGYASKSP
jgi:hypothetical protein